MTFITYYLLLILTFLQDPISDHCSCLKILNSEVKKGQWILEQYIDMDDFESFQYFMVDDNDTIYNILYYVKKKEIRLCQSDFAIVEFMKRYKDQEFNYTLQMDTDTLFFYKSPINQPEKKIFEVGKYYYIFSTFNEDKYIREIKDCQLEYFFENMDSLKRIRGDSLQDLPCIPEN